MGHVDGHHPISITFCAYHELRPVYTFPTGIQFMGFLMALAPVALIIIGVIMQTLKRKGQGKPTDFKSMTSPNEKWGSALVTNGVKKPMGLDNQTYIKDEFSYGKYSTSTAY